VHGLLKGEALRRRVTELLEMVGLPRNAAERYPHAFSSASARAIEMRWRCPPEKACG